MKIRITLKDPDTILDGICDAIKNSIPDIITDKKERDALFEVRMENLDLSRWIRHGEYIVIEIDTENNTATVVTNEPD